MQWNAIEPRLKRYALIGACLITAFYALTTLALPFGWDHGMMASVGSSYVHGSLPYLDSWDVKGPAAFLPYAMAQALFGPNMWGIRILDVLVSGIASYAFFKCMRALTNPVIGAWVTFALYYWIASAGWFFTAAPESWTGAACVLAITPLLVVPTPLYRHMVIAGALIGFLGLIKPFYLAIGAAPLLAILLAPGLTLWRRAGLALVLGLSALVPILIALAVYAAHGGLERALEVLVLYNLSSYGRLPIETSIEDGWAAFLGLPTIALLAPFVALGIWTLRSHPRVLWPTLAWAGAIVLAVVMQRKYYLYHWMPLYAPLLLFGAVGVHALVKAQTKVAAAGFLALAAGVAFTAQICAAPMHDAAKTLYYLGLKRSPDLYYGSFSFMVNGETLFRVSDELAAARHIRERTNAQDTVFVWGNDAAVRYLADRGNPTRFTQEMPLSLPGPYRDPYRAEAMADLTDHPPAYIVVGINWGRWDTRESALAKFPELAAFIQQRYELDATFGKLDLYRLRASPAADAQ